MEHGHSLVIPRHFDGNNYTYLKISDPPTIKAVSMEDYKHIVEWKIFMPK